MINKPLDEITEADLNELVRAAVAERKTLDYKRDLPTPMNDAAKRELLADISSFANTEGGDLVFGIDERGDVPVDIPGVKIDDPGTLILQYEQIIRDGLSPSLQPRTRAVPVKDRRYVLIIRVGRSPDGPHRVDANSRFYARGTNGKFEMDVNALRNAFRRSKTATEKATAFRLERINALANGDAFAEMVSGPKLVLHCMPLESFRENPAYNLVGLDDVWPMAAKDLNGWGAEINLEGVKIVASGKEHSAYTQIFRNGMIEAVRVGVLSVSHDPKMIPSLVYEKVVVEYLPQCFGILKRLGCPPPVVVGISLIGVRGSKLFVDPQSQMVMGRPNAIDRDVLELPEIVAEDLSAPPSLKPAFDRVWNACGYPESPHFDAAGNWIERRN
jgi:hypothetical protein